MVMGFAKSCLRLLSNHLSHTTSFTVCPPAIYSALVLNKVTALCFFELQLIVPPASISVAMAQLWLAQLSSHWLLAIQAHGAKPLFGSQLASARSALEPALAGAQCSCLG